MKIAIGQYSQKRNPSHFVNTSVTQNQLGNVASGMICARTKADPRRESSGIMRFRSLSVDWIAYGAIIYPGIAMPER